MFGLYGLAAKIIIFVMLVVSAFFYGMHVQKGFDAEAKLKLVIDQQKATAAKQAEVNKWAEDFSRLRFESDNNALSLRKRLGELNGKLATCNGNVATLTGDFRVLYNSAIAADPGNRPEPVTISSGASAAITPEAVVEVTIENGKRWKQCRDQLTSLIAASRQVP